MNLLTQMFKSNATPRDEIEDNDYDSKRIFDPVLGECKFSSGKKSLYVHKARPLLHSEKVVIWELNRPLISEHVDAICRSFEAEYKETNKITLFGSLSVIRQSGLCKIIDGQHRFYALRKFLENHQNFNPEVVLEVYDANDHIIQAFCTLNNVKPQDPIHKPSSKKETLSKRLLEEFPCIKNQSRTKRPYITLKSIMDTISLSDLNDYDVENVISQLRQINLKLSNLDMESLFNSEYDKDPELCHRIYASASELNFYLGIRKPKNGRLDW